MANNKHHRHPRSKGGDNTRDNVISVCSDRHALWHQIMGNDSPLIQAITLNYLYRWIMDIEGAEVNWESRFYVSVKLRKKDLIFSDYDLFSDSFEGALDFKFNGSQKAGYIDMFGFTTPDVVVKEINNIWGFPDYLLTLVPERALKQKMSKNRLSEFDKLALSRFLKEV